MNSGAAAWAPSTGAAEWTPSAAPPPTLLAIDVECVATGHTHNDRAVAQIAVVDERMRTLVNVFVKPGTTTTTTTTANNEGTSGASTIVSTIEPLTGITREKLDEEGIPFGDGTTFF